MNRKLVGGLLIGVLLVIILVVLLVFYMGGPPPTGPGPVTAPGPTPAPAPAVKPPAAPPAPEAAAPKGPPATLPSEQKVLPKEVVPSPEVRPPAPKVTVFPPEKEKEHYAILVRRYRKYRSAAKRLERLKKKEIPGFIRREARQRRPYEVWAGPFPDRREAEAAKKSLRAMFKKTLKVEKIEIPVPK
jgi:cell division septation protein DedD